LSQRKGLAYLFEAVALLKHRVALTVVGQKTGAVCPMLDQQLARHRWIRSLPHPAILKLMGEHDVLVFPSLFEGFGLVITEAMSQGLPVITTNRTAGPDLIKHGQSGWLVEAASTQALYQVLDQLLLTPECLASAGREAAEAARLRPWQRYGQELAEALQRHLTR
jgi:glycosyltransferase involved in cell wall biosynthesis